MKEVKRALRKYKNNPAASAIVFTEDFWDKFTDSYPDKARELRNEAAILFTEDEDKNGKVLLDNGKII